MRTRDNKPTLADRIRSAFKIGDTAALDAALSDVTEGSAGGQRLEIVVAGASTQDKGTKDDGSEKSPPWFDAYTKTADERMSKCEDGLSKVLDALKSKDEKGEGEGEDKGEGADKKDDKSDDGKSKDSKGVADSADLEDEFRQTLARAEILAPGIKLATFDAKVERAQTVDRMCALRRRALVQAADDKDTGDIVKPLLAGRTLDSCTCDAIEPLFVAAAEMVRNANSAITTTSQVHDHGAGNSKPASIADINKANREFWAKRGGSL